MIGGFWIPACFADMKTRVPISDAKVSQNKSRCVVCIVISYSVVLLGRRPDRDSVTPVTGVAAVAARSRSGGGSLVRGHKILHHVLLSYTLLYCAILNAT